MLPHRRSGPNLGTRVRRARTPARQRAHQNTLEGQPLFLALLLFGSIGFPGIAAVLGFVWLLSRVAYSAGCVLGSVCAMAALAAGRGAESRPYWQVRRAQFALDYM